MKCPLLCIAWNIKQDDAISIECMRRECGCWNESLERCGLISIK